MWNPALRCVPRSASSPERRRALELLVLAAALSLGACSRGARAVRLPAFSPDDEIYRISCEGSIDPCRAEAAEVCGASYEVLESTGAPIEPERVTSAPGPASTGPRYQRKKWLGQMVVACGPARAPAADANPPAPAAVERPPATATAAPERLCVPGATQECLGPGACRGAQACSADGNGYGPCDCGPAAPQPAASVGRSAPDGGAPAAPSSD
jgi:hypothetical protein